MTTPAHRRAAALCHEAARAVRDGVSNAEQAALRALSALHDIRDAEPARYRLLAAEVGRAREGCASSSNLRAVANGLLGGIRHDRSELVRSAEAWARKVGTR